MMMQMLAAGGMPLLTDGVRAPDWDNPRGYFEFEPVKRTRDDPSWVPNAIGKAVKMVTMLLRDLPAEFDYRVILLHRDLDEILASQKAMLRRLGRSGPETSDENLKKLFEQELERVSQWMAAQPNFRTLTVIHHDCFQSPAAVAESVNLFLNRDSDVVEMAKVVDSALYRKVVGRI